MLNQGSSEADNFTPKYLLPLAMVFAAMLLIANTIAVKIVQLGPFNVPAGILCFPITYIFGDVLVEVYGYARTRRVIWTGLACQVLMAGFYYLSTLLAPAVFWQGQEAWTTFFSMSPRIVDGSLAAYAAGEFVNAIVMSKMKMRTAGRHLWMRTIGSTLIGEGVDTAVFNVVAFLGVFASGDLLSIIVSGYLLKVGYEVVATPLTYAVVGWLKRQEGIDHFDYKLRSYNPFTVSDE
jgi:queuosine precursor transporter